MKRIAFILFFSLLALVSLSACGKQGPDSPDPEPDKEFVPIALTKAEAEIGQASNQFGFDIYHKIYESKDMLLSPLSLSLALSMAANGAEGTTAEQMLSTLGFAGKDKEAMNTYYQKMTAGLLEADPKTTFEVANSIWADEKIGVKKSFTDITKKYFNSEVYSADFKTQATVNAINKWCSDKTHGKINSIMDKPDPNLVMALINALYFKGEWSFEFNDKTKKEDFTDLNGGKAKVDMMSAEEKLLYAEKDGYSMVRLPYGNGAFSMDVILPPKGKDFGEAVAAFNAGSFENLDYGMSNAIVNLKLPKFTFEYTTSLVSALQALGMTQAFTNNADFSAMAEKSLKISTVMQKTFIDVNEKGTEAAAVTFIGFTTTAFGPSSEPRRVDFFADRPFLFLIRENSTGAILFIGQKVK
jgi:serpin B